MNATKLIDDCCNRLEDLPVSKVMQTNLITTKLNKNLQDVASLMAKKYISFLPVLSNYGICLGIISDRDIIEKCIAKGIDPASTTVSSCMTKFPYRIISKMSCSNAIFLMSKYGVSKLLVVKGEKLIGIVSASDIAKVYNYCPNNACPKKDCILIDIANESATASHLKLNIELNTLKDYALN